MRQAGVALHQSVQHQFRIVVIDVVLCGQPGIRGPRVTSQNSAVSKNGIPFTRGANPAGTEVPGLAIVVGGSLIGGQGPREVLEGSREDIVHPNVRSHGPRTRTGKVSGESVCGAGGAVLHRTVGCADFKIGRRRTRGKMEALAVDENGTASQRISCPKGYPVGIGIHIHPVADQFQAASEVGIARIGDIDQSRSIRSPDSDGARPIELGMQVDGSAGKSKGSAFTDADNSSIVRIYADSRTARESERTLFNSEVGQGIPCVSKGQRARSRFGQGSAGPHDIG